ncbi:MAG: hypothetical protein IJA54_04760 [Tyzzerella sp.]|nr:hypothetical protein [Tyzzerella sp.]
MKKRIFSLLLAIVLCIMGVIIPRTEAKAEVISEDIAFSDLLTDDALIGYAQNQTWGVYFSDGGSIINKISSTKVGAGGVTNANVKCTVKVTVILERRNSDGGWGRVTSWNQTNTNAYSVVSSKSVTVASGYYYRVRCYHYASTDTSSSFTNALWVGN